LWLPWKKAGSGAPGLAFRPPEAFRDARQAISDGENRPRARSRRLCRRRGDPPRLLAASIRAVPRL